MALPGSLCRNGSWYCVLAGAGFSYGRLLHSRGSGMGSGMGNPRPSEGLDNMSSLEEAMLRGGSKEQ